MKEKYVEHKKEIDKQVQETREQLKVKQQLSDAHEDPDSRMEVDRERREKKGSKVISIAASLNSQITRFAQHMLKNVYYFCINTLYYLRIELN